MYTGHPPSGNGSGGSWSSSGVVPSSGNSSSTAAATRAAQELAYQELALKAGMYSTPSANEMSHYQQLLLQQQRQQQHQSAQHQAMQQQQQQQLLQQQAIAQAELRSRELNIQSATNHQHVQHQTGAVSSAQNSSNQFLNHPSSAMYSLPSVHLGSSGGTVTSINVTSVPNSSPNMAPHLTSMASSRGNMAPPSNNTIRTNSSSNNSMMPPPPRSTSNMLPPSAIPRVGPGVKDRRTELQRKKDEAFLQRKRERENLERTKMEQEMYSKALFDAPVKTTDDSDDSRQVADILGDHSDVANIINSSTVSCIGIDYQPPTPATPANHHIIGGEDDDEPSTNGSGNSMIRDTQNSGANQRRSNGMMHPPNSHYGVPRNTFGVPQSINPYMNRNIPRIQNSNHSDIGASNPLRNVPAELTSFNTSPSSRVSQNVVKPSNQLHPQISPDGHYSGSNSEQLSPHPPHRRQPQPLHRAPLQPPKPQNSTQLQNRELINSARLMGSNSQHSTYPQHGLSPGDSSSRHSSLPHQSNHPLENMLRLSTNAVSTAPHHRETLAAPTTESQIRGINATSSQGTTAISPFSTNMSSSHSLGLKTRQQSPASLGSSHSSNKMKPVNGLPPLNIEAAKADSRKQEHAVNSHNGLTKQPSLQAIFDEMAVCPPLSAIETPRVSDREGYNHKNAAPVYSFGPISEPPTLVAPMSPMTPMSSDPVLEDIPATKSSAVQNDPSKVPMSMVSAPNLSEESDSDHASFEPNRKPVPRAPTQLKSSTANPNNIQTNIRCSESTLSDNNSSRTTSGNLNLPMTGSSPIFSKASKNTEGHVDQSISKSPRCKSSAQNSDNHASLETARNLSQAAERGSSSDSTSNTDTSDSESSSEEEENGKNNNKSRQNSEAAATSIKSLVTGASPSKPIPNEEFGRLPSAVGRNTIPRNSPFDPNNANFASLESNGNIGDPEASEQEAENDGDGEGYGLDVFYKKVIKSTHSPHSQPSPKIFQGSDSVHGGSRSFKSGIGDSPTNSTCILDQHNEVDDPILGLLSNTNQQLPDYSDLISDGNHLTNLPNNAIKNSSRAPKTDIARVINPKKKTSKGSSRSDYSDKSISGANNVTNGQVLSGRSYENNTELSSGKKKKGKRKRSSEFDNSKTFLSSATTSDNESATSKNSTSDGKKRSTGPRQYATPKLRVEKDSDDELGEDLLDIQNSSYGPKQGKKSSTAAYQKKKESPSTFVSPSRRGAAATVQSPNNGKARLPKSPSKNYASKRIEKLHDTSASLSVSSSSEDDDQTDQDWTERGPKRQKIPSQSTTYSGGKINSKSLSKVRGGAKTSPKKMVDITDKTVISDKEYSNHSSNEDEYKSSLSRSAKGKGGKGSAASAAGNKPNILSSLFRKQALRKKESENIKTNERSAKLDDSRFADTAAASKLLDDKLGVKIEEPQSPGEPPTIPNFDNSNMRYRSKKEHPEISRPVVVCRIPLASIKNLSQNLGSFFDLKDCSVNVKPSRQLDTIASLVSPSNKREIQPSDAIDTGLHSVKKPSSERSTTKRNRDRSRRDSSASSSISITSSKHVRKKRSRRHHTQRGVPEETSDSDQGGSVHSSSSSSHVKRRRKDLHSKENDSKASLTNTPSRLLSDDQRSISSPIAHNIPIKAATHKDERVLEAHRVSSQNQPIQLPNKDCSDGHSQEHPGYHDVQYYGYNEHNQTPNLKESNPSPSSVENPTPSTSNSINDTQSHQSVMMPPPNNKMFYSYLEQRRAEDEQIEDPDVDPTEYMIQGKGLKHEADKEPDRERQAMKYLQAVLYFILYAHANEQRNEKQGAFTIYQETLNLVKHVCRPFKNSEFGNFDNKLAVISLRCQSLLFLKLYKMRRHELKECQKIIGDHIQKASSNASQPATSVPQGSNDNTSPNGNANNTISPTPSPAGSEGSVCSKSSGYTSSGEQNIPVGGVASGLSYGRSTYGVLTPPTNGAAAYNLNQNGNATSANIHCLSVPSQVMEKQYQFCSYLSQCHELWELADLYTYRGHCKDFIIRLDRTCGPLTLHSTLKELVTYTQEGLNFLSKEIKDDELQQ